MRLIERIYGRHALHDTLYMLRVRLIPRTRWGQLYLHVFFRGDEDKACHDHPWCFWTFPLTTYWEYVRDNETGRCFTRAVQRLRWHYRPATHTHRVLDPAKGSKLVTLVWHGVKTREWGFWVEDEWVHWLDYLYSGEDK